MHYIALLFLLLHIFIAPCWGKDLKELFDSNYGISANNRQLLSFSTLYPTSAPISRTGKALLTLNKTGFDVLDEDFIANNWLLRDFFSFCKQPNKTIADIGGGYGNITKAALKLGATVI